MAEAHVTERACPLPDRAGWGHGGAGVARGDGKHRCTPRLITSQARGVAPGKQQKQEVLS